MRNEKLGMRNESENTISVPIIKNRAVQEKSCDFAIRIIKLYKYLCNEKHEFVLSKQILKSGTSIGANIAEAEYAISRNDFISKLYIALKETSETLYWLKLLYKTEYLSKQQYESLFDSCEEIRKLLSSSTKTMNDDKKKE